MPTAKELRETRTQLLAQSRHLVDTAAAEKRDMTAEENEKFAGIMAEVDKLPAQLRAAEQKEWLEEQEAVQKESAGRKTAPQQPAVRGRGELDRGEAGELFRAWALAGSPNGRPAADVAHRAAQFGFDVHGQVVSYSRRGDSERALSKGTTTAGGFTVPQSFSDQLEKVIAWYLPVAEAGGIGVATDPTFGQVTFKSWDYYSPIVKISNQLLRDSARDVPGLLAELFGERMGRAMDAAVVSSNAGTAAPEGILHGVSAGVNLASGNAITFAKLLDLETSVDLAYRNLPGSGFVMHDATWQAIRALVDSTGRPLVNMDIQNGVSKRLLGYPVFISNNMTSIASAGDNTVHILFGALKKYKIRRVGGSTLTRLNELYAGNGQVGFCLAEAWDGRWTTVAGVKTLNALDS